MADNSEAKTPASDSNPIQPQHYQVGGITTWQVVEAWDLGFNLGNTVKYIQRYRRKGTPLQDLKKAREYLDHEIELMEKQGNATKPI